MMSGQRDLTIRPKKRILKDMSIVSRKLPRFADCGRVDAPDISLLPGVLEDISLHGCRVRFPLSVKIDIDNDYELKIRPSRKRNAGVFILLCHPQWIQEANGYTEIGFEVLRSPDTARLNAYIKILDEEDSDTEDSEKILDGRVCLFV
jgi:hypothetical protein